MPEEQDYIIVTIEDDIEDNNNDDPMIIEDSETEVTENTVYTNGMPTIQPNFQDSSDNYQPPSQMLHEVEGLAGLVNHNQQVAEMNRPANLKRSNPNSVEVQFIPVNKKAKLSIPMKDHKEGNASGYIYSEHHQNQFEELQHYCEGLQDFIDCIGRQVNQLYGIVSNMQHFLERSSLPNTASLAVRTAVVPEEEPNLANIPEMMNYASIMGNNSVGPDTAFSSSLCISPKLDVPEIEETIVDNNPETMNCPTSLGNDSGQCSSSLSVCLPTNFAHENVMVTEMVAQAQTSEENNSQAIPYPILLIANSDLATASPSISNLPNLAHENVMVTEMVAQAQTSEENNSQTMPYPILLIINSELATACPSVSILPNLAYENVMVTEMVAQAQTSEENNSQAMLYPILLIANSDLATAFQSISNLPNLAENVMVTEMVAQAQTSEENNSQATLYPILLIADSDLATAFQSISNLPNLAHENAMVTDMVAQAETSEENNSQRMPYPILLITDSELATASPSISNLPDLAHENAMFTEMVAQAQTGEEKNSQATPYPMLLITDSDLATPSPSISNLPNLADENVMVTEMVAQAQTSEENNSQATPYPILLIANSDLATGSPSISNRPNLAHENVMVTEMMVQGLTSEENNSQKTPYPILLITDSDLATASPSISNLPDLEKLSREETNMANSTQMVNNPPSLENNSGEGAQSFINPSNFGFLGDPKRNVYILKYHLRDAQRKGKPKLAARYLVRAMFSKEVLLCSSVGVKPHLLTSTGCQPLDPNKMAAIREYLATVFPNHDLRECGKDWKDCISYIRSLIRYLCSHNANKTQVVNSQIPINPNTPSSGGLNDEHSDSHESSFQLSQQAAASKTRANGRSQQKSSARPKAFIEFSIDYSKIPLKDLRYIGHPSRNVKLPYKVLNIAKKKPHPELSARYLIINLFPGDILMKSNVHGNVKHGLYALDPNRIAALREFLQDNYPKYDLREAGRDWKSCVIAINSRLCSLRHELSMSIPKSQPLSAMTPSTKSEQEDTE